MISFLSPLFLAGAVAAAIPIVLHLMKREPEARVRFSAVQLLEHAPVEHTARRRLRELLLLALRVTALLLLALAFARPFMTSGAAAESGGVTVIALDRSLSMSGPGQFERLRQRAREALARVPSGDAVAVITFADTADVAVRPSADRGLAESAIDAASPGFGRTRYRAALAAAADLLERRHGTIVVVTDLQESGWSDGDRVSIPESVRIEVLDVGAGPPNLAVTAVRMAGDRSVATVKNTGDTAREARVTLRVDGRPAGEAAVAVPPGESADVPLPRAKGTAAEVAVVDRDGVPGDNTRYAILDAASHPPVLVVTASGALDRDAFYLQHALQAAGPRDAAYQVDGAAGEALASWDAARLQRYVAVVVLSTRGVERRTRELLAGYTQNGGGLLIAAGPGVDADVAAALVGGAVTITQPAAADRDVQRTLAPADMRHPIFRAFEARPASFGLVTFRRIAAIEVGRCTTLARFTTGEAGLVECPTGSGRVLVFASDLENGWNNFPLHASFVPFVHQTMAYLAGSGIATRPDEYLIADLPPGTAAEPGLITLNGRRVAVNVDPAEVEARRLSVDSFEASITRLKDGAGAEPRAEAQQQEGRQRLWQYVLALMLGMLALESFLGTRTA